MADFTLLTAQSLTQADRHSQLTATTETNIPAYAFIPANAMPAGDSSSASEPAVEIHWRFWAFMNTATGTGGASTDTVTIRLYCGPTPGNTGTATAMWATPPTFVINRTAGTLQAVTFELDAVTQRSPSTTIYGYHRCEFTASPNGNSPSAAVPAVSTTSTASTTFAATTVTDAGAWNLAAVRPGMLATTSDGYTGLVASVNDTTNVVTVTAWVSSIGVAGTPANTSTVTIVTTAAVAATTGSPLVQNWSWIPGGQSSTAIGLRDGPYYMWLTTQFNSNLAVGGFFDVRSTVVKAYGLNIQD